MEELLKTGNPIEMKKNVIIETTIDEIKNMRALCNLCSDLKHDVVNAHTQEEGIQIILDYDGFACGVVQNMKIIAWEVKNKIKRLYKQLN